MARSKSGYVFSFPPITPRIRLQDRVVVLPGTSQRRRPPVRLPVTFFRVGIDYAPANPSKWAVRDLYMTHVRSAMRRVRGVSICGKADERGPGWQARRSIRYTWNDDWTADQVRDQGSGIRDQERAPHVLVAKSPQAGIDLVLDEGKAPAINVINGINQKGARQGNASHYYSLTRMPTKGTLTIDGERFEVTGLTWMDHEFSTSFLEPEQRGWDWFSIQLSDNRELMLYRMRRADGSRDPRSSGTLIDANGRTTHLSNDDFTLTPGRSTFKSKNGAVYRLNGRSRSLSKIELTVTTPLSDQELSPWNRPASVREGMIDVTGRPVVSCQGSGYLEMTGYHSSLVACLRIIGLAACGYGLAGSSFAHRHRRSGYRGLSAAARWLIAGTPLRFSSAGALRVGALPIASSRRSSCRADFPARSPSITARNTSPSAINAIRTRRRMGARSCHREMERPHRQFRCEGWEDVDESTNRYVGTPSMSAIATLSPPVDIGLERRSNRSICCPRFRSRDRRCASDPRAP